MYPVLIQNQLIEIYSYPFMMGIAWAVAYFIFEAQWKISKPLPVFLLTFISAFIGAKILFLIVNRDPDLAMDGNFWMGGGFVFYGGLIASMATLLIYFKIKKIHFSELNSFILPLVFAHGIGRIGCFLAGCCFGHDHFPIPLLESIFLISLGIFFYKRKIKNQVLLYLLSYGVFRFLIEFARVDYRGELLGFLSPAQEISLFLIVCGLMITFKNRQFSQLD